MTEVSDKPEVTFGKITDEGLANMSAKFGVPYYPIRQNEVASKDSIRQFCNGIGDENPLFRDPEYATRTKWGHIIAPSPKPQANPLRRNIAVTIVDESRGPRHLASRTVRMPTARAQGY